MLSLLQSTSQTAEVNWAPLSDGRREGKPNLETQVQMKTSAQVEADMPLRGAASSHLVL